MCAIDGSAVVTVMQCELQSDEEIAVVSMSCSAFTGDICHIKDVTVSN